MSEPPDEALFRAFAGNARPLRLFIGVACPCTPVIAALLDDLSNSLGRAAGLRVVARQNLHITLKFIGAAEASAVPGIVGVLQEALANHQSFELQLQGAGSFQSALWLGVAPNAALNALAATLNEALTPQGFAPETKPFRPHLTLARLTPNALPVGAYPEGIKDPPAISSGAGFNRGQARSHTDEQLQMGQPVLVICPGAEFGDAKQWPAEHYSAVCQQQIDAGWQVWILGSAKDSEIATAIRGQLTAAGQAHCHDLTGRTSLAQAIDLMSLAAAVLSNDSGLMHVAAALGRPIVALYGSTSADFTPPLADNVQLLAINIDCRPCFERTCPLKHKRCLVDLSPQLALAALQQVLAQAGTSAEAANLVTAADATATTGASGT